MHFWLVVVVVVVAALLRYLSVMTLDTVVELLLDREVTEGKLRRVLESQHSGMGLSLIHI